MTHLTVAISAPGGMGAAVGARLVERGLTVLTPLAGRGQQSVVRAQEAGMRDANDHELAGADIILSIMPPAEALPFARRMAPVLHEARSRALYVDCNAVSAETARQIAAIIQGTGARFVDASIIGFPPPRGGNESPTFFCSGELADELTVMNDHGIKVSVLADAPIGAASALKMSYGGLTKGLVALGSALILAAERSGAADALHAEMQLSQPQLYAWLARMVPGMYSKAYRWVAEMEEVQASMGVRAENAMFAGAGGLFERLAADQAGDHHEIDMLSAFFAKGQSR